MGRNLDGREDGDLLRGESGATSLNGKRGDHPWNDPNALVRNLQQRRTSILMIL